MNKPIAIAVVCADLHLCMNPPPARSGEKDWFATQARYLTHLSATASKLNVPILCAGDIFDKWNSPAELINFALNWLPEMHAVPGQHDLPFHAFEDLDECAFGTLVKVGKIKLLGSSPVEIKGANVYGSSWKQEIPKIKLKNTNRNILIIHKFIWDKGTGFPGAPESARVSKLAENLQWFDLAVFGDNHKPFQRSLDQTLVWNCGGFMRRRVDEALHRPRLGIIYSDRLTTEHFLDISQDSFSDQFVDSIIEVDKNHTMDKFLVELSKLGKSSLDFKEAVNEYFRTYQISQGAKEIILNSIHE